MRILFYSNALWAPTGYGNQTALFVRHLNNLGHEIAVACNYGLNGARISGANGETYYPAGSTKTSNEIVQAHADDFKADVIISLYDVWPLRFSKLKTPWIAWTPVDHDPVPRIVVDALLGHPNKDGKPEAVPAFRSVAFSEFGQRQLIKAGIDDAAYIPLGIDTKAFIRRDKAECRERLGLSQQDFIVGFVGTNKFFPSRKSISQVLQAFASYRAMNGGQETMIILHTEEQGIVDGTPLKPLLDALHLGSDAVRVCDQYQYAVGFGQDYMATLYNAIDVLINPSMGEGFGIPMMEAQACGTPVIANEFTAMTELVGGGWLVTDYERWWSQQQSWLCIPHEAALVEALQDASHTKSSAKAFESKRMLARSKAEQYDFETVVAPMWDKCLRGLTLPVRES